MHIIKEGVNETMQITRYQLAAMIGIENRTGFRYTTIDAMSDDLTVACNSLAKALKAANSNLVLPDHICKILHLA